jgi:hypothetical protein
MTVRQLEALIRLSEAIARSHLERVVSEYLNHNVTDDNIQYIHRNTDLFGSVK